MKIRTKFKNRDLLNEHPAFKFSAVYLALISRLESEDSILYDIVALRSTSFSVFLWTKYCKLAVLSFVILPINFPKSTVSYFELAQPVVCKKFN